MFASGQDSEISSGSEGDEEDEANEDDAEDGDDNSNGKPLSAAKPENEDLKGSVTDHVTILKPHKRRLSSDSESELVEGTRKDRVGDALSPKKPRLQKATPKTARKKKDRNPFR